MQKSKHVKCNSTPESLTEKGGRTGLMARASDSGSGDPGSILGRVGVFVSLSKRHLLPKKVLVIPRNRWLRLNMTEKLFTGTLNHNQNKTNGKRYCFPQNRFLKRFTDF